MLISLGIVMPWIYGIIIHQSKAYTVHFGYSGHLGPGLSGHYIRMATISEFKVRERWREDLSVEME